MHFSKPHTTNEIIFGWAMLLFVASLFVLGIPYPAMMILLLATGIFVAQVLVTAKIDRHPFTFLLLLVYVALWGLMTGGFQLKSLASPSYLGGEGRIFIAYMPLFLIYAAPQSLFREHVISKYFRVMFYIVILMVPLALLHQMHTLFGSHHAAGYAASGLFVIFAALYSEERKRWQLVGVALCLVLLMFANSRTAILSLGLALVLYYRTTVFRPKILLWAALLFGGVPFIWSALSPDTYERLAMLFDPELWRSVAEQFRVATAIDDPTREYAQKVGGNHNVLTRVILWGKAAWYFEHSPFLGIGSFRFNDQSVVMSELAPMVTVSGAYDIVKTVETAHNSYFHVLAEGGVVGLILYLSPWVLILISLRNRALDTPFHRALVKAGVIMVFFLLFGALTGHLFAAPAITFWVLLICGIALRTVPHAKNVA